MTKIDAMMLYDAGRTPKRKDLSGTWQVKMWGWRHIMRLDRKVVGGRWGHNVILGIEWGRFRVVEMRYCLQLDYAKGSTIDYLKLHPNTDDIMLGRYYKGGRYVAMFALIRCGKVSDEGSEG